MSDYSGAVILVIGASGGLGSRIAAQLADAGATVVRTARHPGDGIESLDLMHPDSGSIVDRVVAAHGHLDGVVVAAGVVAFGPAAELGDDTLRELFEVNALGPIRVIRAAIPRLAESGAAGRDPFVLTMSGVVSEAPTAGLAAYSAAKSALAAFMQASAREVRRSSIRMIDARQGHTETELSQHPIAGIAPKFPPGHTADAVAARIVRAILDGEQDLPSAAFVD